MGRKPGAVYFSLIMACVFSLLAEPVLTSFTGTFDVPKVHGVALDRDRGYGVLAKAVYAAPAETPDQPPAVINRKPAPGEEQPVDQPIAITFDQAMDQPSVEAAFTINPPVKGTFTWQANTLQFMPEVSFVQAQTYLVRIGSEAKSATGQNLVAPVEFRFQTVGYLEVAEVLPAPDTTEVEMSAAVMVIFNRPVVPLTSLGQQASLPQPLTFTPPVQGKGEWLNTSIYSFKADGGFRPATTYKARVAGGLRGAMGSVLKEDYVWEFKTKLPAVVLTTPADKAMYVGPSMPITVTFNQPMDHASAEAAFSLTEMGTGQSVMGTFSWASGPVTITRKASETGEGQPSETVIEGESMIFTPAEPLKLATTYIGRVARGAKAAGGGEGTPVGYVWEFTTISAPAIKTTEPADGETQAELGGMTINFTSPINPNSVVGNITIVPTATKVFSYWSDLNTQLRVWWDTKFSTAYTVTLSRNIEGAYGHKLDRDYTIRFTTKKADPSVDLINRGHVGTYSVYTTTMAFVNYRNVSQITYSLYRLDFKDFLELTGDRGWELWNKYKPGQENLLRRWSQRVTAPPNVYRLTGTTIAAIEGEPLSPGLYLLDVSAPGASQISRQIMVVSRFNLLFKQSEASALIWVTDLKTGQPASDVEVRLYNGDGAVIAKGQTGPDGVFQAEYERVDPWEAMYVVTGDPSFNGDAFGLVGNRWNDGISPWDFNLNGELYSNPLTGYLYTDRPIYRLGQKVYFKGILRQDDWARYSLPPAGQTLTVTIENGRGEQVYKGMATLNDMGTFNGQFTLSEAASLGYYSLTAVTEEGRPGISTSFQVAEYRKPQFEVSLATDRKEYLNGDTITVTGKAEYYFGGPAAKAKVHWAALTEDATFEYKGKEWYDFTDYDWTQGRYYGYWGGVVTEGDTTTDATGALTFTLPADIADKINSQRYTIDVTVTDLNDQQVSAQAQVVIHKGLFYLGLVPEGYVATANKEAKVNLVTVDWESKPYANVPVTLVFNEHTWYSVQEKAEDGQYYWTSKYVDTPVVTKTVTTDAEGKASATFVPQKGGIYKISASAQDQRGNTVRSSTFMWVTSSEFVNWRQENTDRIDLVADKKLYQVGDTAEVLIPSPYQGEVQALVTIERGKVLSYTLMTLVGNSRTISVPILPEYVPDVFVSVMLIKGQDQTNPLTSFKLGYVELKVSTDQKQLMIKMTPDKEVYQPGETAIYSIEVTDSAGKGKEAELSLVLVDKSVLALAEFSGGRLMDTFWRERGVGVQTGASLVLSVDRRNLQVAPEAKGGGGGEAGGGTVRRQFPDTAYWNAVVRTDANGRAQVKVVLPDTLTTWNMSAKAVTADTEVGEGQVDVRSTKPLHVRSVLPRFFVVGDRANIGSIVHNETDTSFEVTVNLRADGLEAISDTVVIRVPAHDQKRVDWAVTVADVPTATIRFTARTSGLSDAEEFVLPVNRYLSPEVVATSGQVGPEETRTEVVEPPARADVTQGELKLEVDPSLAAGMRNGLTYLETYPYDCIEQTVSRFLPNIMTYRALQNLGLTDIELAEKLPTYVTTGLQRIYALQHMDGGWGWWFADESNPFLTAYVLFGLNQAKAAGFSVEQTIIDKVVKYLKSSLPTLAVGNRPFSGNAQAFILFVLADAGQGDLGRTVALYNRRTTLGNYGRACLAMALALLDKTSKARVNTLLNELDRTAVVSATGVHWEETRPDYWTMNTDVRSTAVVLEALLRTRPDSKLLPNVVRWLMAIRKEGRWASTQENAWAIMALTDYMVQTGELEGDYSYQVLVNSELRGKGTVTARNIDQPNFIEVAMADLKRNVTNSVSITRLASQGTQTGAGQLYYSMFLRYFLPVPEIKALSHGVVLARQYSLADEPRTVIDTARVGDVVQVKLTIVAPNDLYYVVVEDPLPAGCEALDQSLKITSKVGQPPELKRIGEPESRGPWGWWWFSQTEVRDNRVVLFATYLPKGTYEYTYLMRASLVGEFRVIPSTAYEMYFPEVFGRGDGMIFTVGPAEK